VVATAEVGALFTCTSCGLECTVSQRHARRYHSGRLTAFRCLPCRAARRVVVVDDRARLFWLRRYTDEEIACMAAAVSGGDPDLERIARERRRLAGALALPP
jgi:hypothetical protein